MKILILCQKTLKAIAKDKKTSSIIAMASEFAKKYFHFNMITIKDALKEISMLGSSKAIQAPDKPVKAINGNSNFFAEQTCAYFDESISKGNFPFV